MQINLKQFINLLFYEVLSLINSKFYIYIMFLFFFNGTMLAILVDDAIIILINLIITTFSIAQSYENQSFYKKYLYITLGRKMFFWHCFALNSVLSFILIVCFMPIFAIFLNLSIYKFFTIILLFVLCSIVCNSILTIIYIIRIMSFMKYNFLISMLFPIMMPFLLICNLILQELNPIYIIILFFISLIILLGSYFANNFILLK